MESLVAVLAALLAAVLALTGSLVAWRVQDRSRRAEMDRLLERIHALEISVARLQRNGGTPK